MDNEDLLGKAKSGDYKALIMWSRHHRQMISRLAFQAGMPVEDISHFYRKIIKDLGINLENIDASNADYKVLETVLRILETEKFESGAQEDGSNLKYPEDLEAHHALQNLPMKEKLAVILSWFHDKSTAEIDELLGQPESNAVDEALIKIRKHLAVESDSDVRKRLEFLGKSYNRISFPEEDDYLIEEMPSHDEQPVNSTHNGRAPVKRKTIAILASASLFLSAVIGTSFLFNDQPSSTQQTAADEENPTVVTKAMVKKWEAEYEAIRESAPERLGLSREIFEQLEYVRKADELKDRTFSRQNVRQLKDDPKRMLDQVEVLMLSIETPKGMLDSIEDYSLLTSEVGKFLWIYTEKTEQLMTIADGLLEQYQDELADAEMNGELSAEKLSYSRGDYPEEIERLTKALREYTLQYTVHPNEGRFRTVRDIHQFYAIHPFNSDMQSTFYLDILQSTPYFDETGMLWPIEQMPQAIMTMAMFMSDPTMDPGLQAKVEPQFVHAFYTMLNGSDEKEVFDSNGVVKEEYRMIWENLLHMDNNPLTYIVLPILEEFEASGWKKSAHYDKLGPSTIMHAIAQEKNGELAAMLPNGDLEVETSLFNLDDYDYSDIQSLYEKFSQSYDEAMLSGVDPLDVIKLYYYANQIEDGETMWHLTADDMLRPSLEEYLIKWRKLPEFTEVYRQIEVYGDNLYRQGRKISLTAMGTKRESNYSYYDNQPINLITVQDGIWKMQHPIDEFISINDDFEEFDASVKSQYKDLVQSGDLDSLVLASPAETAGVFLLANEKEDIKTMRLMISGTGEAIDDNEFKLRWMTGALPVYSKLEGISFRADTYNLEIHGLRGSIDAIYDMSTMEQSHYLAMVKVDETWMIEDMFSY